MIIDNKIRMNKWIENKSTMKAIKDKMNMPTISSVNQDYVVSYLRCQVGALRDLLDAIEKGVHPEYRYLIESIRRVEVDLRRLRNFIEN